MKLTKTQIRVAYHEVLREFNASKFARKYGTVLSPVPLHLIEVHEILKRLPEGGKFLDIGTGYGLIPHMVHKFGAEVTSVDFATTGGDEALERLVALGIRGHFVQVGADSLPVADASIDVVFAGNVIEHLPHSPKRFLQDLWRILKHGGHIVIDTKNAVDLKTRLKMVVGISNWPTVDGIYYAEFNPYHHKEYTLSELIRLLELARFDDIRGMAFEVFFFKSLKRLGTLRAMGARAQELSEFGTGFNFRHPYEYLRLVLLATTYLLPNTRSDIMAIGRKNYSGDC